MVKKLWFYLFLWVLFVIIDIILFYALEMEGEISFVKVLLGSIGKAIFVFLFFFIPDRMQQKKLNKKNNNE
jgi:hypothetical protein